MDFSSRRFRNIAGFPVIAILGFLFTQNVFADLNGRAGRSGLTGSTCTGCHANAASLPTVTFTAGPMSVVAGSTSVFTVTISGGPGMNGSIDVAANGGTLEATGAGTQLLSGEVVHNAPKPFTGGSAMFSFSWTAPATAGSATLFVAGMSDNGSGTTAGDGTTLTTRVVTITGGGTPVLAANPGGPYTGTAGLAVQFSGAASTGSIASYVWNFGDGTTGTGVAPAHVYATNGTFQVTLTVTDTSGVVNASRTTVTIGATAADPSAGEMLYEEYCSGCHADGGPGGSIFGESAEDIAEAFAEIPDHADVAAILTEEDIAAIAEFLNAPPDTSVGAALFEENCAGCHSDGGPGGSIFGESLDDIFEAFEEYPDEHADVAGLPEEDLAAIAEYLNACGDEEEEEEESLVASLLGAFDDDDEDDEEEGGACVAGGGITAFGDGKPRPGAKAAATATGAMGGLELLTLVGAGLMWAGRRRKK